ncbi:MAG TPA: DUF3489 domain-containing protein [Rhizomicrobium sp.]|nr:DUF3489 domain-containing protein [Rhizomicrobium sp.]
MAWCQTGAFGGGSDGLPFAKGVPMKSQSKLTAAPTVAPAASETAKSTLKKSAKRPIKNGEVSGKLGKVVTLLKRPRGANLAELMKATGWQQHSVRGAISGAIRKRLKLTVVSEKTGAVRTYRIKG